MPIPLLRTKLYISPLQSEVVARPRLVEALNEALDCKLILISAPAGFGKTTLLKEWIARHHWSIAWVSLDPGDNDPVRFWIYVVAALQNVLGDIGAEVYAALQTPQPPPLEYLLTDLINDLSEGTTTRGTTGASQRCYALVLDDYHLITDRQVHNTLTFFLDHLPPQLHLILSSRTDPPWQLASYRASRQMAELRAQDLRFTSQEAAAFLNDVMQLNISLEDVAALEIHTEGWIVGLHMAALSMRTRQDKSPFIKAFTGTHRFILDYLVEEVLNQQAPSVQDFLLKTSILDRMTGDLCDGILDHTGSQAFLLQLEQANLFLVPLDDERCWYRYHHLFSELLRSRISLNHPEQLPILHRRASQWFEEHDFTDEAISHAFAARDFEQVSRLIEKYARGMLQQSKYKILSSWIEALPMDLVLKRPWLCVYQSWTRHWAGLREGGEDCLENAEGILAGSPELTEYDRQVLVGYIAMVRAHYALTNEALKSTIEQAHKALQLLPEDDYFARGTAGVALGGAYWGEGDVWRSEMAFAESATAALKGGFPYRASSALCYVGMQQVKQARLMDAEKTFRDALALAEDDEGRRFPNAGYPLAKLAELACEWNNLDQAYRDARSAVELCNLLGHVDLIAEANAALARVQLARQDYTAAEGTIRETDHLALKTKLDPWAIAWLDDCRIRLWFSTGRSDEAVRWIKASDLQINGSFNYQYNLNHIHLAQVLIAQGKLGSDRLALENALNLLDRLQVAAEKAGWTHQKIQILILQAMTHRIKGDNEKALDPFLQAILLAEPSGYLRVFINEGPIITDLLTSLLSVSQARYQDSISKRTIGYIEQLLAALLKETSRPQIQDNLALVEGLTPREIEILRLLTTNLTVPEIANQLVVSANTIRSHIKHIYDKLGVHRRLSAVQKAKDLDLV
jgi:LuxR family maltose regulon positive regulatory protein